MSIFIFALTAVSMCLLMSYRSETPVYHRSELMGKFEPSRHPDFARLPSKYTNREDSWLRKEVVRAFRLMADSAREDGIRLVVVSATRNHEYQLGIWGRKWSSLPGSDLERALKILEYSSMPGTSRHHWGTDLDINSIDPAYFERGRGKVEYAWLAENAHRFGFFQPYTEQSEGRSGYNEEKWHWSYQPVARKLLKAYNHLVKPEHIAGFPGAETNAELNVIGRYVNGISEFNGDPFLDWEDVEAGIR